MSEETSRAVAPKQLVALVKEAHQKKTRVQSINGELGARVKAAVDNGHLHRGAYALMLRLYRMDEERRDDFIRSIQLYLDICRDEGLFGEEHVGDLVDKAEAEAPAVDEDEAAAEKNAKLLRKGIKKLDDGADAPGTYKVVN